MANKEQNEELEQLRRQLQQLAGEKETYTSAHTAAVQQALEQILSRQGFSYDPAGDALYNRYKDHYEKQGRRAMEDTLGQAAALTGGYGNSYAQTAAQQVYTQQLDNLQEKIPELYALALETYRAEGDALQSRYDLLRSQEQQDYSRYRDRAADYAAEQKRLTEAYKDAYSRYADQRDFNYRKQRDKVTDRQWQEKFDESVRQFAVKNGW